MDVDEEMSITLVMFYDFTQSFGPIAIFFYRAIAIRILIEQSPDIVMLKRENENGWLQKEWITVINLL